MADREGGCMCGVVRFSARDVPSKIGACHCEMCRRWTGSALLGVSLPKENVTWHEAGALSRIQSSHWAERGFCNQCGTGLYFQVTMESKYSNDIELPIGIFDDANGFEMTNEIYIDHKPDSFTYAGDGRKLVTRAECVAAFSVLNEGSK